MPRPAADPLLNEVERVLKDRYNERGGEPLPAPVPSTAQVPARATRVDLLLLPDSKRARMPLTKEQYLVRENPQLVMWERETRKFLRLLSPEHEHRVAAAMIYEWATGLKIKELMALEKQPEYKAQSGKSTWRSDVRKINSVLEYYFGKSYMTWIAGRKVARAFVVRKGYYIYRHRPKTLTLWVDWKQGIKL